MRDPARIHPLMEKVEKLWKTMSPDLRFCQFMSVLDNEIRAALGGEDPFYLEDDRVD